MKKRAMIALVLCLCVMLCACERDDPASDGTVGSAGNTVSAGESVTIGNPGELFTDRDYEVGYDDSDSVAISLNGSSITAGNGVTVDGTTATITQKGTYVLTGSLTDGMIVVDVDKEDKVQLVLSGVSIHSQSNAAIYIRQADKVFLTLDASTENFLSNGGSFTQLDGNNIDGVIFSKEDLTLNGEGSLSITSPGGHGIVSKDELTVTSGTYTIDSASHGISGKDNVCIANASFTITAGKDGIQADHDEDEALGFVYLESGSFRITSEGDGISASGYLQIQNGQFTILCGGGSENAQQQASDSWGIGGFGGGRPGAGNTGSSSDSDSTSMKALKATGELVINGGSYTIDCADDAIHSNSNVTVTAGSFTVATGDDGIHADNALSITGGVILITESYEGLEGQTVSISGGEIAVVASDDGINAAGGTDQSGMGGFRGGDMFGSTASSSSYIQISGGTVYLNASGDGIDSNGSLTITGGHTTVCGQTQGDTSVLDYETTGTITGGTFIGTGAYTMAQTFSSSENQGVIALSVGYQSAGTEVVLKDSAGNVIVSVTPQENFAIVSLSTPDMVKGKTYTIDINGLTGDFQAS